VEPPLEIDRSPVKPNRLMEGGGVLVILPDAVGFLVRSERVSLRCPGVIYVSPGLIRRFDLRSGQIVQGVIRPPEGTAQFHSLLSVESIDGNVPLAPPTDSEC
jgi:transcription termination factor Rho